MDHDQTDQNSMGQGGMDSETERRNRENETGQQSPWQSGQEGQQPEAGQQQQSEFGQSSQQSQTGQQSQSQSQFGQSDTMSKPDDNFSADEQGSEGGSGFVGSSGDQSSDYLTKGDNQDFAQEGQGASSSSAGNSDIESGQPTRSDPMLDDGADTSQ